MGKYKDKEKCQVKCIKVKRKKPKNIKTKTPTNAPSNVPSLSPSLSNEPSVSVIDPVTINFEQTLRISSPKQMNTTQQIVYANTIVNIVEASNTNVQATCVVTDQ